MIPTACHPCPCGSSKMASACCWTQEGWNPKAAPTSPPAPKTGFSHGRCYAKQSNDCSEKISSEHFMSRGIIEQLGDDPVLSGAPWQETGEEKVMPAARFASKMMCERHNLALCSIDAVAVRLFKTLRSIDGRFRPDLHRYYDEFHLFSGVDVERWMLKALCGMVASRHAAKNGVPFDPVPEQRWVDALFGDTSLPAGAGLYYGRPGRVVHAGNHVGMRVLEHDGKIAGLTVDLGGFGFVLSVIGRLLPDGVTFAEMAYKPGSFRFDGYGAIKEVLFAWDDDDDHGIVPITHVGRYTGRSPDL